MNNELRERVTSAGVKVNTLNSTELSQLQFLLGQLGFYDSTEVDGLYGPNTQKAWRTFKESVNQHAPALIDYIGPSTLNALIDKVDERNSNRDHVQEFIERVCEECDRQGLKLKSQKAYVIATVKHETANTFKPINEYGKGKGRKYGNPDPTTKQVYYGRGFVQLTWKTNYEKYSKIMGIDLVNNPSLALDYDNALFILVHGFKYGTFTGRKLENYVNESSTDFVNARRCINGTDRASSIAEIAVNYLRSNVII